VETPYTLRHFRIAVGAFFAALAAGALLFGFVLHESPLQAIYRSTVTLSLTGIDTKPDNSGGLVVTIVLILAGMAIYGYLASSIVELIAHGVLTGTMSKRRRRHMIDRISDHYIVCGFGRVGRQVADEFRDAGVEFVVLDFNPQALEVARQQRVPYLDGSGTTTTSTSPCPRGRPDRISRSYPGPQPRMRRARCCAPAPTGSSSPMHRQARR
jgi:voltage-gated potassium channel